MLILTGTIVVSLALICSFTRMRNHLNLGDVKQDDVSEDTVKAVAETLRKSTLLKVSEDGECFWSLIFLYLLLVARKMQERNEVLCYMYDYQTICIRFLFVRLVFVGLGTWNKQ